VILILDYGASNLRSVQKAFEFLNIRSRITDKATDIKTADKILLPGVGAFGKGIEALNSLGFQDALREHLSKEKSLLGICLGMQLLLTDSHEMGEWSGLNLVEGQVRKFDSAQYKVPQIGWNQITKNKDSQLLKGIRDGEYFYFIHSYFCAINDRQFSAATSNYAGINFCAAIEKNFIFALQFHPEKSGTSGLKVLENFARL
jgi:imidazole glycerol-phosphate synthase subunit HisH